MMCRPDYPTFSETGGVLRKHINQANLDQNQILGCITQNLHVDRVMTEYRMSCYLIGKPCQQIQNLRNQRTLIKYLCVIYKN